jgi:hypothetical protein
LNFFSLNQNKYLLEIRKWSLIRYFFRYSFSFESKNKTDYLPRLILPPPLAWILPWIWTLFPYELKNLFNFYKVN